MPTIRPRLMNAWNSVENALDCAAESATRCVSESACTPRSRSVLSIPAATSSAAWSPSSTVVTKNSCWGSAIPATTASPTKSVSHEGTTPLMIGESTNPMMRIEIVSPVSGWITVSGIGSHGVSCRSVIDPSTVNWSSPPAPKF